MKAYKIKTLITGQKNEVLNDVVMVVEGKNIVSIGKEAPKDVEVVDLSDKTVIPGLIDTHVHVCMSPIEPSRKRHAAEITMEAMMNVEKHLKSGVTFLRDVGGEEGVDLIVRDAIKAGKVKGCEIQVAGAVITMTGGHGWQFGGLQCDGEDEVRKGTRLQLRTGVDLIKIMATGGVLTPGVEPGSPQLTEQEMRAACEEAHKAGKKVATHAQGTTGIKNAIRAGVDSVEHGIFLDEEAIQMLIDHDVYLVPTLAAPHWIVEKGVEAGIPEFAVNKSKRIIESHIDSFVRAHKAGVKIAMGTDAGTPFNLHDKSGYELVLMNKHGMSELEAIHTATYCSADLLGILDSYGTLEVGKVADFVVYDQSPAENMEAIMNPSAVYKFGQLVD